MGEVWPASTARISVIHMHMHNQPRPSRKFLKSISTVGFAKRVGVIKVECTEERDYFYRCALIGRYRREMDDLKDRLVEKEVLLGLKRRGANYSCERKTKC